MTTPNDLPSVGTPEPRWFDTYQGPQQGYTVEDTLAIVSERDELASRVRELEGALCQISDMTYDSWTNGAIAKQIADAALIASKEQP